MPLVRPFCRLIAIVLLAMWLPATMHCGLEALGSETHVGGNLCDDKGSCDHDACDLLEAGGYMGGDVLKVQPVLLTAIHPFAEIATWLAWCASPVTDEAEKPPLDFEARERSDWRFIRRAARLPGAPQQHAV